MATADEGTCEIHVTVDGAVALRLAGAEPIWEVIDGAPQQVKSVRCSAAAPSTGDLDYIAEKTSGRGEVTVTGGRVEIRDSPSGASDYKVVVRWKRRSFFGSVTK